MGDEYDDTSPPKTSFLPSSPRFLNGFLKKTEFSDSESSPTSILEIKNSPTTPFRQERGAIGLALIDSIVQERSEGRVVLLGSKLKVQIPSIECITKGSQISPPAEFGIKTRKVLSPFSSVQSRDLKRQLSLKEMELSEEYTCVITHGPNPKTTHIFDDCVVKCCGSECGDCSCKGE